MPVIVNSDKKLKIYMIIDCWNVFIPDRPVPQVLVFGRTPGSRSSGVPGSRVGYMPQELALFGEFSIGEYMTMVG